MFTRNKQRCQFLYWNHQQCSLPSDKLTYCKHHLLKGIAVQIITYFHIMKLLLIWDVPTTEYIVIDPSVIDRWKAGSEFRINIYCKAIQNTINRILEILNL